MLKSLSASLMFASALFLAQPAFAGSDLDPASAAALKGYTLSMEKVNAMGAALDEMSKVPGMREKAKHTGDDSKTVIQMEAKVSATPQMLAIYKRHGLSAHDAVVMPFVLMDAGMAVAYPSAAAKLSDRMSPAQVAFYKQHQAELQKVKWLNGG